MNTKNNTMTGSVTEIIEARTKALERVTNTLRKLEERRNSVAETLRSNQDKLNDIDAEMANLMKEAGIELPGAKKESKRGGGKRQFPRGVLTLALIEVLKGFDKKKGADIATITEAASKSPMLGGKKPDDIIGSVRNMLNNSEYFENTGERGFFRLSGKKPEGTLFHRLQTEVAA